MMPIAGHRMRVEQKPSGRWVTLCECGFGHAGRKPEVGVSTSRTEAQALGKGVYHWRKVVKAYEAAGMRPPFIEGAEVGSGVPIHPGATPIE